jgi:hypothetical protein
MKLNEEIRSLMDNLAGTVVPSVKSIENGAREFDPDEAFDALVNIAELKRQTREVEDAINELFVAWMRLNGEKLRDYGTHVAERKISSSRKNWEHKTLLEAVVNMSLSQEDSTVIDPNTGEVIDLINIAKPLIDNVVKNLAEAAAIRDWRVTALRAMIPGLNPDDFCEVEKTERVSIRRKS